jgi:hypothetical protein
MLPFTQTEAEYGPAIGWISTTEMLVVVAVLAFISGSLSSNRLADSTEKGKKLARKEEDLKNRVVRLEKERGRLRTENQRLKNTVARLELEREALAARKKLDEEIGKLKRERIDALAAVKKLDELARKRKKERDLALAANRNLEQGHAAALARLKMTYENRFEGVQLKGDRVLFLVDRSGSMGFVDEKTPEANKWPTVCETVRRIMRSLPELKQYQVITVADTARHPLGGEGQWLKFDPEKTPDHVYDTLREVRPDGGTNLYTGLDAAFTYRKKGLSAIYFFSDGLPNQGPGLTAKDRQAVADARRNRDEKRAEAILGDGLGTYVRQTVRKRWNAGSNKVRIEAVGFFYESPELGSFLWALSRENGGNFVGMSRP